jgi:hypothetical protein
MIKLDTVESEFGTICVFKKKSTSTITYERGGCCQSEADSNGVSLASYIHAIFGLIAQTKARRILMIGCAGGTLATMLAQAGCKVTILDHHADRIAASLSNVFHDVRLLDSTGYDGRNAIVMGGAVSSLRIPEMMVPPAADRHAIESELATMTFRAWRAS